MASGYHRQFISIATAAAAAIRAASPPPYE